MDLKVDTQAHSHHDGGRTASSSSSTVKLSNACVRLSNNDTLTGENSPKIRIFIVLLSRLFYRQWGRQFVFFNFPWPFRPSIQDFNASRSANTDADADPIPRYS